VKVTAQEEYGLRCLVQLARAPDGCRTIPEIAAAESLSGAYVAKLMRRLRQAGYVQSIRGQKGGYRLARPADQIRLGAALADLGGRIYEHDFCARHSGNGGVCVHDTGCAIRSVWSTLEEAIQEALGRLTLLHLVNASVAGPPGVRGRVAAAARRQT
jgi:Rrf2 family protein